MRCNILTPLLLGALLAAGCSSDDEAASASAPATDTQATDSADVSEPGADDVAEADTSAPESDTSAPESDIGEPEPDTSATEPDTAGPDPADIAEDAGEPDTSVPDEGPPPQDAGPAELLTTPHTFTTSDGKTISALLHVQSDTAEGAPGVLLLHQFSSNKNQWDPYIEHLTSRGWVALAIDIRGHGDSDAQDGSFSGILSDPTGAPEDVKAALAFLTDTGKANPEQLAVIGTSIGANLACVAMANDYGVKLTVAVSARDTAVANLAGAANAAALSFDSLYCLAGANDSGGDQAATCTAFADQAGDPKGTVIIPDSAAHGSGLLSTFPDAWDGVASYLEANL
ncbi:MAG: dienelactone hydrolase [Myxococcota bacterium]